jgi:transcriptional regulator with XRE-family HTH domain
MAKLQVVSDLQNREMHQYISAQIRAAVLDKEFSLGTLSCKTGITVPTLSRYVSGDRMPSLIGAALLCSSLGKDLSYLNPLKALNGFGDGENVRSGIDDGRA